MITITGTLPPSKEFRKELARLQVSENGFYEVVDAEPVYQPAQTWQLQEETRPFDWQDRVVIAGSVIVGLVCLFLLLWGPR